MTKIIRNGYEAKGGITNEEKQAMKLISEKWIRIAYRTEPINKEKITEAIKRLYNVSGLEEPRVIIVPSPLVMALAYGLSSAVWYLRENKTIDSATCSATRSATYSATYSATESATDSATDSATYSATELATDSATCSATYSATLSATDSATLSATDSVTLSVIDSDIDSSIRSVINSVTISATRSATESATDSATRSATDSATDSATRSATESATESDLNIWLIKLAEHFVGKENIKFALNCCNKWYNSYQGGNMWVAYPSYLEACRDVLKLNKLDCWDKYQAWEDCAKESGLRVLHEKFCIISDFPEKIQALPDGKPHCETGPSHLWRDGFKIYHLNGVKVPEWLVETAAEEIDVKLALKEKNADVQREIIRKIGYERFLKETNSEILDTFIDKTGFKYELMNMKVGNNINRKYLYFEHASMKGVYYAKPVPPETKKALHGRAWILSLIEREELDNIDNIKEEEILNNLPMNVS